MFSTVATVSETGLVTALEKGSVTVTATLPNGSSASQTVTVRSRHTVCLDAGHQKEGIYTRVPVGPGATDTKTALSGGTAAFDESRTGFLSVFSHSDTCKGVTIRGTKYELEDAELNSRFPLGVSNEFLGREAAVTVREGIALLVFDR